MNAPGPCPRPGCPRKKRITPNSGKVQPYCTEHMAEYQRRYRKEQIDHINAGKRLRRRERTREEHARAEKERAAADAAEQLRRKPSPKQRRDYALDEQSEATMKGAGKRPVNTNVEGTAVLQLILGAYKAMEEKRTVSLV